VPNLTYENKGWKNWGDFLGTGFIAFTKRKYRSFKKAREYAQALKLKSSKEWYLHTKLKNFPNDIPISPRTTYKKEFKGMGDFLGTGLKHGQTYQNKFKKF
jgi:hypothetical protein